MSVPPSPPSDDFAADERRLQRFLELAAPVLLEEPDVEREETWRELERLAERTGLSGTELRGVVESLRKEGVLLGADTSSGTMETDISDEDLEQYLAPLRPPRPPPVPIAQRWRAAAAAASRDPTRFLTGDSAGPRGRRPPTELKETVREFLRKAEGVIIEQRGLTVQATMMLADLAHSMGLAEEDFDLALGMLRTRTGSRPPAASDHQQGLAEPTNGQSVQLPLKSESPANTVAAAPSKSSATVGPSAPTEVLASAEPPVPPGKPPTEQATARRESLPADRFRQYLKTAIEEKQRTRGYVSESAERKLVDEGVRKLGLSPVFARHLVHESADGLGAPVLSRQEAERDEPLDERLERFMMRAGPILAQERGATQRAYVLLSAVARELEMDETIYQEGMRLLQDSWGGNRHSDDWNVQRRDAWRTYLRGALQGLAGNVLTPPELENLVRVGEQRFGVENGVAITAIRESAGEARVHLIWQDQAFAHMRTVIEQAFAGRVQLDMATKQRLVDEGGQWGVADDEMWNLVREQGAANFRLRRRERQVVTMAIAVGCLATVIAMGAFYWWVFLPGVEGDYNRSQATSKLETDGPGSSGDGGDSPAEQPAEDGADLVGEVASPREPASTSSTAGPPRGSARRGTWWDDGMQIAWVNLRRELTANQLARLKGLDAESPVERGGAYGELVRMVLKDTLPTAVARNAFDFCARAAARDPDNSATDQWLTATLASIPDARAALPESLDQYETMILAVRLVAIAKLQARDTSEREGQITDRLERKLPAVVTVGATAGDMERQYVGELMRRWNQNLTHAAKEESAERIAEHWEAMRSTMARNLQREEVVRLAVEVLRVVLPRSGEDWRLFQNYIQDAIFSPNTEHVLRMVEVFERLREDSPRRYMAALLLSRAEVSFQDFVNLDEIPRLVREALGSPHGLPLSEGELTRRWIEKGERMLEEFGTSRASDRELAEQTFELSWHASLGMALARKQLAAAELLAQRPVSELVAGDERDLPLSPDWRLATPLLRHSPSRSESLRQPLDALRRSSGGWQQRLQGLDMISSAIVTQPSLLSAEMGVEVATYLLSHRSAGEHRERLRRVPLLRESTEIQIALAHALADVSPQDSAARETVSAFFSEEGEAFEAGPTWPRDARRQMLRQALARFPDAPEVAEKTAPLAQLQERLRDEFFEQARLIGMESDSLTELRTASAIRRRMLEFQSAALQAQWRDRPGAEGELSRISSEVIAAEFMAPHDLAFTLLLERLWLRLLIWEHNAQGHSTATAEVIRERLVESDRDAKNQLEQLRATQAAQVRLWLLKLKERS